ncbi:WbqC-like protein family protein [Methanolobus vulcani]|uniref:WbqC-like protein family protein n=1 Tax=Methanolobus vulcani TaxID=38026 RepID=A0A7Z7AX95_9EURY|nr:WbqC family protein [Methanolobus vulcani]SDF24745.1 WbqC-like protein family protein [Methanolobus vulcani]
MIVGIHQPNYLPYLGFFDKMLKSDVFIIYDDAQFNKSDFQHRNRIKIFNGSKWLTVPVSKKHIPINEIKIKNDFLIKGIKWNDDHFNQIYSNYSKSACFEKYINGLKDIYENEYELLVDLNIELIRFMMDSFSIKKEIILSSEFGFNTTSSTKIVDLVKAVGGDTYLSGPTGKNYMDLNVFSNSEINVVFQTFVHPQYKQQYMGFLPNMSSIDALLNGYRFDYFE